MALRVFIKHNYIIYLYIQKRSGQGINNIDVILITKAAASQSYINNTVYKVKHNASYQRETHTERQTDGDRQSEIYKYTD